jgi:hypothetical protein
VLQRERRSGICAAIRAKWSFPVVLQLSLGRKKSDGERIDTAISGTQLEERFNELNLPPNIRATHPPNLSLADHVHRLIPLDDVARRVKVAESLFRLHATLNRSMILLQDVV